MAGFYGPKEEWELLEAPIKQIDAVIDAFAAKYSLELTLNHKNWPERSLLWKSNGMDKIIQVFMNGKDTEKFNLWLAASRDVGKDRYWKNVYQKKDVAISEIARDLSENLEKAKTEVDSWQEADLRKS